MRTVPVSIFVALALARLSLPPEASGQQVSSPYRFVDRKQDIGAVVAYQFTDRGSARLGPESGPLYGIQYNLRLSEPLSLGAFGAYFPSQREVIDPTAGSDPVSVGQEEQDLLLVAGRLNLNLTGARTWNDIIPHAFGGIGMAIDLTGTPTCIINVSTNPDCQVSSRDRYNFGSSFMLQFGVGAAWLPSERLGLRVTLNDNIWRLETPPGFFDEEIPLDPRPPDKDWTNNLQLAVSLSFWF